MDFLHNVLTLLHLLGFASLFAGVLIALRATEPAVNAAMLHGALTQLVTGVLLVGLASGIKDDDFTVDNTKIAVKLAVVLVITVLLFVYRRRPSVPRNLVMTVGGLTLLNVVIAVFWT